MPFPTDFTWGAATAAYQIEGATTADGRGPSVWDNFDGRPTTIANGYRGTVAADHYHRWPEDVAIMRQLGLRAYRLSVSWPRVVPAGTGRPNDAGLAFYDRLIDALLAAGVTPWVTRFHWDYPCELYCPGGWLNPDGRGGSPTTPPSSPTAWATASATGSRSTNPVLPRPRPPRRDPRPRPQARLAGRAAGDPPRPARPRPGRRHAPERCKLPPTIGWAPVGVTSCPATDSAADVDAARAAMFGLPAKTFWTDTLFSDPVCLGRYPEEVHAMFGDGFPTVTDDDLRTISQPLDFYGVNIYQGQTVAAGDPPTVVKPAAGHPMTSFYRPVTPAAMYWGPRLLGERYQLPVVIIENGMGNLDSVTLDGRVHDPQRIDFAHRYLRELRRAIDDGVDVRGYFHWTVMDNFEWAEGYRQRFGLVYVDYATLARTPKDSAHWYAGVIATNGADL